MSIVFDDMITDMHSYKTLSPIVTKMFLSGRKVNISHVFLSQSYFIWKCPKTMRLNWTPFHYENNKEKITSTNRFESFISHWVEIFKEAL